MLIRAVHGRVSTKLELCSMFIRTPSRSITLLRSVDGKVNLPPHRKNLLDFCKQKISGELARRWSFVFQAPRGFWRKGKR